MKKCVLFFMLMTMFIGIEAFSFEENDGDLSPSEIALCSKNGCFGQGVPQNVVIKSIGAEVFHTDKNTKDKYVIIPVFSEVGEYTILQWIGTAQDLDKEKLEDARAFCECARKSAQSKKDCQLGGSRIGKSNDGSISNHWFFLRTMASFSFRIGSLLPCSRTFKGDLHQ